MSVQLPGNASFSFHGLSRNSIGLVAAVTFPGASICLERHATRLACGFSDDERVLVDICKDGHVTAWVIAVESACVDWIELLQLPQKVCLVLVAFILA